MTIGGWATPHWETPRGRVRRLIWWLGQTSEYHHEVCGERHIPGPCHDGRIRNPRWLMLAIRVVDYPPFVALWRLAAPVVVGWALWSWLR